MKNKYKNSPIAEAVCEFRFDSGATWDMAIPGLIYERVKEQFPKRKQIKRIGVNLLTTEDSFSPEVTTIDQIRFLQDNERIFLAVSPHVLSAHVLEPYSSWRDFLPSIKAGFRAYREITNPKGLNRIGLRYINKIVFDQKKSGHKRKIDLEDYLEFRPHLGQNMNQDYSSFSLSVEQVFESMRDNLKILVKNEREREGRNIVIVLDFDYSLQSPGEVALDDVFSWVELAHTRVYGTFEACISEKLRKRFKPEKT